MIPCGVAVPDAAGGAAIAAVGGARTKRGGGGGGDAMWRSAFGVDRCEFARLNDLEYDLTVGDVPSVGGFIGARGGNCTLGIDGRTELEPASFVGVGGPEWSAYAAGPEK